MQIDTTPQMKPLPLGNLQSGAQPLKTEPPVQGQEQFGIALLSTSTAVEDGCCGFVNPINRDEFMAAWGSAAAEFDLDNTGVVDGADLALFLGLGAQQENPVALIEESWGSQGDASTDLNGDQTVDGSDLTLALAQAGEPALSPSETELKPLHDLLENWGTDSPESDMNQDGVINGQDLTMLLAANTNRSMAIENGFPTSAYADRVIGIFEKMGFKGAPPSNLGEVVDGLNIHPINAKALTIELLNQYKRS